MNAAGAVVGTMSTLNGGRERAFVWRDGQMAELPAPPDVNTRARGINARGQIAGTVALSAAVWPSPDQPPEVLSTEGAGVPTDLARTLAHWISDDGAVVGIGGPLSNGGHLGLLWRSTSDAAEVLPLPQGFDSSHATGIAGRWACGYVGSSGPVTHYPVRWDVRSGTVVQLRQVFGEGFAVNVNGDVAGSATLDGHVRPVIWFDGQDTDRVLLSRSPLSAVATSINAHGEVVGLRGGASSAAEQGFLYTPLQPEVVQDNAFEIHEELARGPYTLTSVERLIDPALGWRLVNAGAISDEGHIVGWGYLGGQLSAYRIWSVLARGSRTFTREAQLRYILYGLIHGEGGAVLPRGGSPEPVGPRGPQLSPEMLDALMGLAISEMSLKIQDPALRRELRKAALNGAAARIRRLAERIEVDPETK